MHFIIYIILLQAEEHLAMPLLLFCPERREYNNTLENLPHAVLLILVFGVYLKSSSPQFECVFIVEGPSMETAQYFTRHFITAVRKLAHTNHLVAFRALEEAHTQKSKVRSPPTNWRARVNTGGRSAQVE